MAYADTNSASGLLRNKYQPAAFKRIRKPLGERAERPLGFGKMFGKLGHVKKAVY